VKQGLLYGYYGYKNLGDDIFLYVFTNNLLKEIAPDYNFTILAKNGVKYCSDIQMKKDNYKIDLLNFDTRLSSYLSKMKYIKYLSLSKLLIFGGGTIFYCHNSRDYKNQKVLNYFTKLNKITKGKTVGIGIGIDRIQNEQARKLVKKTLLNFDILVLRDKNSLNNYELIIEKKADLSKVFLLPDLAYKLGSQINSYINLEKERANSIGINFAVPLGLNNTEEEEYILQMKKIVTFSKKTFDKVYYIIAQPDTGSSEKKLLSRIVDKGDRQNIIQYDGDIKKFTMELSKVETIIASKFHVAVLGHILNKKFFTIQYQEKVKYFMNSINKEKDNFTYNEVDRLFMRIKEKNYHNNLNDPMDNTEKLQNGLRDIFEYCNF
jgi:colanic acid/amylovoran biosynthesis protein